MTWVPSRRRWTRMHKGQRFWISCKALGVPETKEASVQAANAWWRAKQAELDAADRPKLRPLLPGEDVFAAYLGVDAETAAAPCFSGPPQAAQAVMREFLGDMLVRHIVDGEPLPDDMVALLPPARVQQVKDAVAGFRGEATAPAERTVQAHADAWLKAQQARVDAGQMTAARCANNRGCLEHFKTFLGPASDVAGIDAQRLDGFYQLCLRQITAGRRGLDGGWSVSYARDVFGVAKAFVRWLVERGTIDPPRNLGSKNFRFGSPAKAVETWTVDEFKAAVEAAPGKLKLALLLMANCGMTQEDVSDLLDTEVDWSAGYVTRKRSKTAAHDNVPLVRYKLWPRTFDLLKQYRSGQDRVLLTEAGEPFVRTRLRDDGKLSKADGFASNYVHLKRKLQKTRPGFDRPLKGLRKLGATLLGSHPEYGRFQSYFLGHSPRTVADRHYVVPPQGLFDKAVLWLGRQVGQVS
jgi:integrase